MKQHSASIKGIVLMKSSYALFSVSRDHFALKTVFVRFMGLYMCPLWKCMAKWNCKGIARGQRGMVSVAVFMLITRAVLQRGFLAPCFFLFWGASVKIKAFFLQCVINVLLCGCAACLQQVCDKKKEAHCWGTERFLTEWLCLSLSENHKDSRGN